MDNGGGAPRSRVFLLAAILIAAAGFQAGRSGRLVQMLSFPTAGSPSSEFTAVLPAASTPPAPAPGVATDGEDLHDAVGSPAAISPGAWHVASALGAAAWTQASGANSPSAARGGAVTALRAAQAGSAAVHLKKSPADGVLRREGRNRRFGYGSRDGSKSAASLPRAPRAARTKRPEARLAARDGASKTREAKTAPASPSAWARALRASHLKSREGSAGKEKAGAGREPAPKKAGRSRAKKIRPVLLSRLIGKGALRPPRDAPAAPKQNPWSRALPKTLENGRTFSAEKTPMKALESIRPPDAAAASCRAPGAHWHAEGGLQYYHDGERWGRLEDDRWSWLEHDGKRWWIWGGEAQTALLWHQGHWWMKSRETWFLLHEGEPWGYSYLNEWKQEGLVDASGAQMIYSPDGRRVGIIVPGEGAILYDAVTGEELGEWSRDELPRRRLSRPLPQVLSPA